MVRIAVEWVQFSILSPEFFRNFYKAPLIDHHPQPQRFFLQFLHPFVMIGDVEYVFLGAGVHVANY